MKANFRFYACVPGGEEDVLMVATAEIPFVPSRGTVIQVFEDGDGHVVDVVMWSTAKPDTLDIWFETNEQAGPAFFIQQGWMFDTDVIEAAAESLVPVRIAAPLAAA